MSRKSIYTVIILSLFACSAPAQDPISADPLVQIEINKTALTAAGSSDEIRTNAAVMLLLDKDSRANDVILQVLLDANNPPARIAVCNAIRQSGTWGDSIVKDNRYLDSLENILVSAGELQSKAAAEAMLIFDYPAVKNRLKNLINNTEKPISARLAALYALKIRVEKDAILDLIGFVDSPDSQISQEAQKSLQKILGVPVGLDKSEWKRITKELSRKSKDEFLADQLVVQYDKCRKMEAQVGDWKNLFLATIDKYYEKTDNEALKIEFLNEQLASAKSELRLWAVNKVIQMKNNGKTIPDEVGSKLVGLIGDSDRQIRLEVARLLVGLSKLGPAEMLLAQIAVEPDEQVRLEQFAALGEAIYYATSPGSSMQMNADLRLKGLEIASSYLSSDDPAVSGAGAKQMRKMLENNGLDPQICVEYLTRLAEKYKLPNVQGQDALRADLLDAMSRLCSQSSVCRVEAIKLFEGFFAEGITDNNSLLRQYSLAGLVNCRGAVSVLEQVRQLSMYNDSDAGILADILALVDKAGTGADLVWLSGKLNSNGMSEAVWQTVSSLLERSSAGEVYNFYNILAENKNADKGQLEQVLSVLEAKAAEEADAGIKEKIYKELFQSYLVKADKEGIKKYYNLLSGMFDGKPEKELLDKQYLEFCLKNGDFGSVKQVIAAKLKIGDITDTDVVFSILDSYFAGSDNLDEKAKLLAVLESIAGADKLNWLKKMAEYQAKIKSLDIVKEPADSNLGG